MPTRRTVALRRASACIGVAPSPSVDDLHQAADWIRWGCGDDVAARFITLCRFEGFKHANPNREHIAALLLEEETR